VRAISPYVRDSASGMANRLPYAALKRCPLRRKRHGEDERRVVEIAFDLAHGALGQRIAGRKQVLVVRQIGQRGHGNAVRPQSEHRKRRPDFCRIFARAVHAHPHSFMFRGSNVTKSGKYQIRSTATHIRQNIGRACRAIQVICLFVIPAARTVEADHARSRDQPVAPTIVAIVTK
jgi:hypothetical protein